MMKKVISGVVVGFSIVIMLLILGMCTTKVRPGYTAIQYTMNGGVRQETLGQGWHVVSPTTKTIEYPTGEMFSSMTENKDGDSKDDEHLEISTKEGKGLDVDIAFSYHYVKETLPDVYTNFRGKDADDLLREFIKPRIHILCKNVSPEYSVYTYVTESREPIEKAMMDHLNEFFNKKGIVIDSFGISDVRPDKATKKQIQDKMDAEWEYELNVSKKKAETEKANKDKEVARINAEKEKEVAIIKAEQDKKTAIIKAEQEKATAKLNAEAKEIDSKAEAMANKRIADSLTKELIEMQKYEKWDGKLPKVSSGSSILNINGLE